MDNKGSAYLLQRPISKKFNRNSILYLIVHMNAFKMNGRFDVRKQVILLPRICTLKGFIISL